MTNWTTPRTWVDTPPESADILTAALMNTHVRDNLLHLYEQRVRSATGVTNVKVEYGVFMVDGANMASRTRSLKNITFAQAFATGATVVVIAMCLNAQTYLGHEENGISLGAYNITNTGCTINVYNDLPHEAQNVTIGWLAIGVV